MRCWYNRIRSMRMYTNLFVAARLATNSIPLESFPMHVCLSLSACAKWLVSCGMRKAYKALHKIACMERQRVYKQKYGADLAQFIANWLSITLPDTIKKKLWIITASKISTSSSNRGNVSNEHKQSTNGLAHKTSVDFAMYWCSHPRPFSRDSNKTSKQDKANQTHTPQKLNDSNQQWFVHT